MKIFKESALIQINDFVGREDFELLELSEDVKWALNLFSDFDESDYLFESNVVFDTNIILESKVESDFDNAILLYENLALTNVQAVDERLWSYLSLVEFWNYTFKRWIEGKKSSKRVILDRGILKSNEQTDRRFVRNCISRLWWGVHSTICDDKEDKYELTKLLFSYQDIHQQVLERSYSKNPSIIKAVLTYIGIMETKGELTRKNYRCLLKEITRLSGVIVIDAVSQDELLELLLQSEDLNRIFSKEEMAQ
ncbi:DUF6339 family protein [Enterococcus sp. AZ072]|uniref:DUF6339 family protein n=1 Tax=unclassified Enterococcus TaxID=2608891 RepID=UPI003D2C2164